MHILKKITTVFLAALCVLQAPAALAASVEDTRANANEVHVEYMDFYSNQNYYKELAKNTGCTVVIDVGDEYADLEAARIASNAKEITPLVEAPLTRDGNIPSQTWDTVAKGTMYFTGSASNAKLYTKYKATGWGAYEISIYNNTPSGAVSYTTYGANTSCSGSIGAGTSVIRYVTASKTAGVYLGFSFPCSVNGYVARDV